MKLGVRYFFSKLQQVGRFLYFRPKLWKKKPLRRQVIILSEHLKILIKSAQSCTFCAQASLNLGEKPEGTSRRHYHRCRPPTSWLGDMKKKSLSRQVLILSEMRNTLRNTMRNTLRNILIRFWSFIFPETYICYRGCLNLNCYIGKKVQKNFLMGLKIW